MDKRILITGAQGFIARHLIQALKAQGCNNLHLASRTQGDPQQGQWFRIPAIDGQTDWRPALAGCEIVIHTAGRAHQLKDKTANPALAFHAVNTEGTINLARQAKAAGVKRFIFISSIGVYGKSSHFQACDEQQMTQPDTPYSCSKYTAEQFLLSLGQADGETASMDVVIIRPPLVYGPDAPGNFGRLLKLVASGLPMPFGSIANQRSLLGCDNLADFIYRCIDHPAAANQVFVLADGEDLSTTEMIKLMAEGMNKPARLLPIPSRWLKQVCQLTGHEQLYQQLCGNLQINSRKARDLLNWQPPVSVREGLRQAAREYRQS